MLEIIIRSNLGASDVLISSEKPSDFENQISMFIEIIKNESSYFFIQDSYLFSRLLNCTKNISPISTGYYPRIFDSWSCFHSTPPNSLQIEPCPDFPVLKYAKERFAYKRCDENGFWWIHPSSNRTWSNYTNCVDYQDLGFRNDINTLSIVGLFGSLSCLLLSLAIFSSFHSLACGCVTMHKNLILSLVCSNISWLLWYHFVLFDNSVLSSNVLWCRVLHVITTYFTLTTYLWMLCEGAYLHLLLVMPFMEERCRVFSLIIVGWTTPAFFIIPYMIYRQRNENLYCWMDLGDSNWFIGIPVIIVIVLNVIFLSNVIHILRVKLSISSENSGGDNTSNDTIKQARAVLFLVPILGINFMLLPIRPSQDSPLEYFYDILSTVSSSFQGVFVSFLLCFTNSQVIHGVHKYLASLGLNGHNL
jgi:calcitonin receptor-like